MGIIWLQRIWHPRDYECCAIANDFTNAASIVDIFIVKAGLCAMSWLPLPLAFSRTWRPRATLRSCRIVRPLFLIYNSSEAHPAWLSSAKCSNIWPLPLEEYARALVSHYLGSGHNNPPGCQRYRSSLYFLATPSSPLHASSANSAGAAYRPRPLPANRLRCRGTESRLRCDSFC